MYSPSDRFRTVPAMFPARMPFPPPPKDGSIYERQSFLENRYFDVYEEASETSEA